MKMRGRRPDSLTLLNRFIADERGSTAIDYGLIVSLIFLAIMAAVNGFTNETKNMYSDIQSALVN
jgi:pilus assembly protein Flp/PilA